MVDLSMPKEVTGNDRHPTAFGLHAHRGSGRLFMAGFQVLSIERGAMRLPAPEVLADPFFELQGRRVVVSVDDQEEQRPLDIMPRWVCDHLTGPRTTGHAE
jgi:hypothetical protein